MILGPGYRECRPSFTVGRWPSRPPVRRPVQPRARPGHAARGVRPGRGQQRPEHSRRGRGDCRRRGADDRVPGFLDDLRARVKGGTFRPLPVRQRLIPKGHGSRKLRSLGIPTIADRVVQAALKLVLEPIFEADFSPVSYGFRPSRRAHDAIAEIQLFGTHGYRWVLDADIEACFDRISHTALLDRVRARVKDKRVVALVKAFLKAGLLTELGEKQDTPTGTPQGGILSPLLANIALSVLDEHLHRPWQPGGAMSTSSRREARRAKGLPNWRIVRYADDCVPRTQLEVVM